MEFQSASFSSNWRSRMLYLRCGLSTAYLITGTFFVEQVYGWPGIGGFAANSLISVDYPAIMGITILGAVGYLVINFLVDIIYAKLDPRVKL